MRKGYTYEELIASFKDLGIGKGDIVHVHSALFGLGAMEGVTGAEIPAKVYQAFREVLGEEGTLTVPAAFEDYARFGKPYDCRYSPVDNAQGALSQFVAEQKDSFRTYCPMCAVAGVGAKAKEICHQETGSAFSDGSAWEMLYNNDAKLCFLGVRPAKAFTFVMLMQFRHGVPYLYNKIYTIPVYEDGNKLDITITCAVRYLNPAFKIAENCDPFEKVLFETGQIKQVKIGRGYIYLLPSAKAVYEEGIRQIRKNLYFFCKQEPGFIPGEIPMDGNTGVYIPEKQRTL